MRRLDETRESSFFIVHKTNGKVSECRSWHIPEDHLPDVDQIDMIELPDLHICATEKDHLLLPNW